MSYYQTDFEKKTKILYFNNAYFHEIPFWSTMETLKILFRFNYFTYSKPNM